MKLLWVIGAAKWPEPRSDPARHDDDVGMIHNWLDASPIRKSKVEKERPDELLVK